MMQTWKLTALASRATIEAALLAHEDAADWDPDIVVSGCEVAEDRPHEWQLEAWLPRKPGPADRAAIAALFTNGAPDLAVEALPDADWVTLSQDGLEPIRAGLFHVHTPNHPPRAEPGTHDLAIPASQAFGTGQHATTAGCLSMLTQMKRRGVIARNLLDVGTGTGLLAFAALKLWPRALATASDIDAVCADVVHENAATNRIAMGAGGGELTLVIADGMAHPLLQVRGPYDLIIANILAGPLVTLAPSFADALVPGGNLLLAGLLEQQEENVRQAYRAARFRLAARLVNDDWSILWLRKRSSVGMRPDRQRPAGATREWLSG